MPSITTNQIIARVETLVAASDADMRTSAAVCVIDAKALLRKAAERDAATDGGIDLGLEQAAKRRALKGAAYILGVYSTEYAALAAEVGA